MMRSAKPSVSIRRHRSAIRLDEVVRRLGDTGRLAKGFSAGDLVMATVLRGLHGTSLLEDYANVSAYVTRGEARPPTRGLSRIN